MHEPASNSKVFESPFEPVYVRSPIYTGAAVGKPSPLSPEMVARGKTVRPHLMRPGNEAKWSSCKLDGYGARIHTKDHALRPVT